MTFTKEKSFVYGMCCKVTKETLCAHWFLAKKDWLTNIKSPKVHGRMLLSNFLHSSPKCAFAVQDK